MTPADAGDPHASPLWPRRRSAALDWLVNGTADQRYLDNIFCELCDRIDRELVPIARATMWLQTNHPQWLGVRVLWRRGRAEAEMMPIEYGVQATDEYRSSPASVIQAGADEVRARIHATRPADDPYSVVRTLRDDGMTDYVAWPLVFSLGMRHLVTFATDRPDGFREDDLGSLREMLPVLATTVEVRLKNRLARLLLDTYAGPNAGEAILAGATTRGSGFTVEAAIVVVDLRGFTALSDLMPRDEVIALLNDYFDAVSEPIERHGGEILKFMGDGLLAIFPGDAAPATRAVADVCRAMATLNAGRRAHGQQPLGYGIGVNFGDVMYGNIGSKTRLDFTVIGPAVNIAARLEGLTKQVGCKVLFSAAFAERAGGGEALVRAGTFPLRGVGQPLGVYRFVDEPV